MKKLHIFALLAGLIFLSGCQIAKRIPIEQEFIPLIRIKKMYRLTEKETQSIKYDPDFGCFYHCGRDLWMCKVCDVKMIKKINEIRKN